MEGKKLSSCRGGNSPTFFCKGQMGYFSFLFYFSWTAAAAGFSALFFSAEVATPFSSFLPPNFKSQVRSRPPVGVERGEIFGSYPPLPLPSFFLGGAIPVLYGGPPSPRPFFSSFFSPLWPHFQNFWVIFLSDRPRGGEVPLHGKYKGSTLFPHIQCFKRREMKHFISYVEYVGENRVCVR